jgi:23S rRNA pseudouridine1911/1915/1917 synthase
LEIIPTGGKQHQIRTHLAAIGFPIVGDKLYGPNEKYFLQHLESALTEIPVGLVLPRHALHSFKLTFRHPFQQKHLTITAPMPPDLAHAICSLDLNNPLAI